MSTQGYGMAKATEQASQDSGVWVAYGLDYSHHMSTTVFADEVSALRYALANYLTVGFLRFGDSLDKVNATTEVTE